MLVLFCTKLYLENLHILSVKGSKNDSKGKQPAVNKGVSNTDNDKTEDDTDWMKNGTPYNSAPGICKSVFS